VDDIKTMFGLQLLPLVCKRANVVFMLFLFGAYCCGQHVLTVYMSNMAGVL